MSSEERLGQFLEESKDWERKPTNIPGVFIFKLPEYRGRPASLAIEINPLNANGTPSKKEALLLSRQMNLIQFWR